MSQTNIADVQNQVQTIWAPVFMDELLEKTLLVSLVNKDYEGDIKVKGDTVRVSQINRPVASRREIGSGHDTFNTTKLSSSYVDIKANQVIDAAYEFDSIVQLQSQIGDQESKIRQGLREALDIALNDYLYGLVAPSAATPDHITNGVTDFNASQLSAARKLAAKAKWRKEGGWWLLADPSYYSDLLNSQTLTSKDYVEGETPIIGGEIVNRRFGFNVLEDNSDGMKQLSPTLNPDDLALGFHPDFMHFVMQLEPEFKVADLTANKQHGFIIVVKIVVGAKLGIDGDLKHLKTYNT